MWAVSDVLVEDILEYFLVVDDLASFFTFVDLETHWADFTGTGRAVVVDTVFVEEEDVLAGGA